MSSPADMESQNSCTIVIVSYHTGPVLWRCLDAALSDALVDTVVLVDNGNDEATRRDMDRRAELEPQLKIIRGQGNVGFSRACNLGAEKAASSHILLLNPDCVLSDGALERGLKVLGSAPNAMAATVRVENEDGSEQQGARRNLMTPLTVFVEQFKLYKLFPNNSVFKRVNLQGERLFEHPVPVECLSGSFVLMPLSAYRQLGGMDEDYFLHMEDVDLCMRIRKAGGDILYIPNLAVTHVKGTSKVSSFWVEWLKTKSAMLYFRKHFSSGVGVFLLPLICGMLVLRYGLYLIPWSFEAFKERISGSRETA